jgi:putative ubiquitin-RnfH superfamily antitoxin RatB of RatAB toxin-antitoxin module
MAEDFQVEVAYALSEEQLVLALHVEPGTTLLQAVERCGILERFPQIDMGTARVGIFGKIAKPDAVLKPGDRVEIYRPLIADPKEARKKRAAEGKQMKKGGGKAPSENAADT